MPPQFTTSMVKIKQSAPSSHKSTHHMLSKVMVTTTFWPNTNKVFLLLSTRSLSLFPEFKPWEMTLAKPPSTLQVDSLWSPTTQVPPFLSVGSLITSQAQFTLLSLMKAAASTQIVRPVLTLTAQLFQMIMMFSSSLTLELTLSIGMISTLMKNCPGANKNQSKWKELVAAQSAEENQAVKSSTFHVNLITLSECSTTKIMLWDFLLHTKYPKMLTTFQARFNTWATRYIWLWEETTKPWSSMKKMISWSKNVHSRLVISLGITKWLLKDFSM